MNPKTFVAHDHSDLLDLLPALFGFTPQESFIAIATHGPRRRFGFRLRMDMPRLDQVGAAAAQAAGHLLANDADGVIMVSVTEHGAASDALMAGVRDLLGDVPVIDAVRSDGVRMWPVGPDGPETPAPYVARCSPAVVEAVLEGQQILPNREALVARFAPVAGERRVAMEQLADVVLDRVVDEMGTTPADRLGPIGMSRLLPIVEAYAAGAELDDEQLTILAVWVSSIRVRDAVWGGMNRANAATTLRLWTRVAQSVVEPFEPPVLCLTAFAAWLSGDGAQALIAAERALNVDPDYSMAQLILQIVQSGMSPERWEGFDPEADDLRAVG